MHDFKFKKGELHCEGVPLGKIAREAGTPLYVYSSETLTNHYRRLDKAFGSVPHMICYSVKSNSNIAICRALAREGAGFDIVSGGELRRVLKAGASPDEVVFAGVGKTAEEIAAALKKGILFFTVESVGELEAIGAAAGRLRRTARVAVRVTPDVDARTHHYITTGRKKNKFGLDPERARLAYEKMLGMKWIDPVGIQMHIGSQITETEPYVKAIRRLRPLIRRVGNMGIYLKYFDIGGGLGIVYDEETPSTARKFASAVLPEIEGLGMFLVLEPGRFIAGNAGVMLTRVLYVKRSFGKTFVVVDAAMNDLIRPSLYDAYHRIVPVKRGGRRKIVADVVGPVCESGDFFAKERKMAEPEPGDLLAVMSAGAYGFSMSSNYNSRRRAAEVLVKGRRFEVIRERESYGDLTRLEKIPDYLK